MVLDLQASTDQAAIRGREQQLIEANGGAKSQGGKSENVINGVSDSNKKKFSYANTALKLFGDLLGGGGY